jgi:hypothetical protein
MSIDLLIGKILIDITVDEVQDKIKFVTDHGETYCMYHENDCCESVTIEEIIGDMRDLIGAEIIEAEEIVSSGDASGKCTPPMNSYDESYTWTFYKIGSTKGFVTIRWYGTSNGYYSESVSFERMSLDKL